MRLVQFTGDLWPLGSGAAKEMHLQANGKCTGHSKCRELPWLTVQRYKVT